MTVLLEILKYTLPLAIMFFAAYLIISKFFQHESMKLENERRMILKKEVYPVRMQAYERIILLLERISPNHLILRMNKPGLNAMQFQSLLTQTIRDEFDHNLSQQIYISSKAWQLVKATREEMIGLINTAAGSLAKEAGATELAGKILELHAGLENDPVARAVEFVKGEARGLF